MAIESNRDGGNNVSGINNKLMAKASNQYGLAINQPVKYQ